MPETVSQILFVPDGFKVQSDETNPENIYRKLADKPWETLYELGFHPKHQSDPAINYLQNIADTLVQAISSNPDLEAARSDLQPEISEESLEDLESCVPFVLGDEYADKDWIKNIAEKIAGVFKAETADWQGSMKSYLIQKNQDLQIAEQVYFHLVENPKDPVYPFAFQATYAIRTDTGRIRHMPLSYALHQFDKSDPRLLSLLGCLSRACEISDLLDDFVISGQIFHPLKLTSEEAWRFLKVVDLLEAAGIKTRIPNWWRKKSGSASVRVSVGNTKPGLLGLDSILSMKPALIINGEKLTKKEIKEMLEMDEGLYQLKGGWVEVDHEKLKQLLETMEQYDGDLSLLEALRLEAGLKNAGSDIDDDDDLPSVSIASGKWLNTMMNKLKNPAAPKTGLVPASVKATLRPYQKDGVAWLKTMSDFGFGACLADDMGLGKTLQVLSFLEGLRKKNPEAKVLLIVPASLAGNWAKEIEKFTPQMPYHVFHGKSSEKLAEELRDKKTFLNITTYGMAVRIEELQDDDWDVLILDEAQAIKNPKTKQTRTIKKIKARQKIALTGTPVENDLSNLWSLFDFLDCGLLGTMKEFTEFSKDLSSHPENYGRLKQMISPFLLRRLKTDKRIIADLPDKIEQVDYISLSKKQVALYRKQVDELEKKLENTDSEGIQRKGLVLAALTKLKQICNHPDQFSGQTEYNPADSGKFEFLKEICESIKEKHECVLVFTQYKELIPDLDRYLQEIFGRPGLVIHGGTPAAKRTEYAEAFNKQETYIPYMILSLRAAGTGLNLTAASHVIHFDRWWNPAVEDQATDRAYRIGQTKNVQVHKFVCEGTIEEKIEELIQSKKELASQVIGEGQEKWITELSNDELLDMMRLNV